MDEIDKEAPRGFERDVAPKGCCCGAEELDWGCNRPVDREGGACRRLRTDCDGAREAGGESQKGDDRECKRHFGECGAGDDEEGTQHNAQIMPA